jgi:hypothetical protein
VIGSLSANGVLGLAPSHSGNSFVKALKQAGGFPSGHAIIGLNYENPLDTD